MAAKAKAMAAHHDEDVNMMDPELKPESPDDSDHDQEHDQDPNQSELAEPMEDVQESHGEPSEIPPDHIDTDEPDDDDH